MMESSLSFLGFGVPPGVPSWGSMLSAEGRQYMEIAPQLALFPGLALTVVVYGINMLGDALRDLLDPRLRGGGGRYVGSKRKRLISRISKIFKSL
jgi:peptide/nickel transport system permease protein